MKCAPRKDGAGPHAPGGQNGGSIRKECSASWGSTPAYLPQFQPSLPYSQVRPPPLPVSGAMPVLAQFVYILRLLWSLSCLKRAACFMFKIYHLPLAEKGRGEGYLKLLVWR